MLTFILVVNILSFSSRSCQARDWSRHKEDCLQSTSDLSDNDIENVCVTPINFEAAFGLLRAKSEVKAREEYPECQNTASTFQQDHVTNSFATITVKYQNEKYKIELQENMEGQQIMELIVDKIHIPLEKLTLVHKGKKVNSENFKSFLRDKAVFMAIGEKAENEEGLNKDDIKVLMKQLSVERNVAVKALRETGDVVDAILHISEK